MNEFKISVVMQSYLKDYPGARTNPIPKFIRAVNSFKNQLHTNSELIIVSDGCELTIDVYNTHFKKDENIRLIYIDKKDSGDMYESINGQTFYRGYPRRIGVAAATGQFITYMDSDDYIMPTHLTSINELCKKHPSAHWFINRSWYDNIAGEPEEFNVIFANENPNKPINIDGLDSEWLAVKLKDDFISLAPTLLSHTAKCTTKWEDSVGISEDVIFSKNLRNELKEGLTYEYPTYVRCHMRNAYDF